MMRAAVCVLYFFFLMIRRPPRSTLDRSSAASDVYKRQEFGLSVKAKSSKVKEKSVPFSVTS